MVNWSWLVILRPGWTPKSVSFLKKQEETKINSHATLLWLLIQCFYYGTGVGSCNMVVYSMSILWSRYWFLCYVCSLNICIMGQILVPILCFLVQCLYYEADTNSYITFVGSMLVLRVVDSMRILWSRYWFLYYACWLNAYIMKQILVPILCLLAQCLYYKVVTGFYAMVVRSMFVLWGNHWIIYYVFWFNVLIMKQCQLISGHVSHVLNVGWKCSLIQLWQVLGVVELLSVICFIIRSVKWKVKGLIDMLDIKSVSF
jgi:hypothetical protein